MRGMNDRAAPDPGRAEALRERHEKLCFARAFPRSAAELRRAERELAGFERRVRGVREELDNSGIAGTLCRYPYDHTMAGWLARRYGPAVTIDWKEYKRHPWDEVAALLSLVVAEAESEGLDDEDTGSWDWVAHARGRGRTSDLQWLLARLRGLGLPPALERHLYEALSLPLAWDLSGCRDAVTHARLPVRSVFYHPGPLLGRPADFLAEVSGPAGDLELLPPGRADRAIDAARAALSQREREFHVIVHANRDETYRFEAGRGLEIYLFGLVKALRLTLEADYGALLVKNGVPVGYGYAALLFDRADLGINVFPTQVGEALKKATGFDPRFQIIIDDAEGEDVMEIQVEVLEKMFDDEVKKLLSLKSAIGVAVEREMGVSAKISFVEQNTLQMYSEGRVRRVIDRR